MNKARALNSVVGICAMAMLPGCAYYIKGDFAGVTPTDGPLPVPLDIAESGLPGHYKGSASWDIERRGTRTACRGQPAVFADIRYDVEPATNTNPSVFVSLFTFGIVPAFWSWQADVKVDLYYQKRLIDTVLYRGKVRARYGLLPLLLIGEGQSGPDAPLNCGGSASEHCVYGAVKSRVIERLARHLEAKISPTSCMPTGTGH